jgi:hypothetical protein
LRVAFKSTEEQSSSRREQKESSENGSGPRKVAAKGAPGEPETAPAREQRKELPKRIGNDTRKGFANETHEALRKLDAAGWHRKALAANGTTEEEREARAPLAGP